MGWWITFGILFLLAILPMGVRVRYDEAGIRVKIIFGLLKITVVPLPKWLKNRKPSKKEKKPELPKPEIPPEVKAEQAKKKGGSNWKKYLPLVEIALDFLGDLRRKLRLNYLQLRIVLAGGDPCDVAVNYGRAWAALGNLLPQLERIFVIEKRDLEVECDFTASKTLVSAGLDLTITLGRVIALGVVYAVRVLKVFLKIKKNKKAVQTNESKAT